mmetsp:Transcript_20468/g.44716  ORF Transcript_20468/g.44716 Transcript_20468/m.44716 type:complete len:208 (-) Transcript_20468:842-1465(-)
MYRSCCWFRRGGLCHQYLHHPLLGCQDQHVLSNRQAHQHHPGTGRQQGAWLRGSCRQLQVTGSQVDCHMVQGSVVLQQPAAATVLQGAVLACHMYLEVRSAHHVDDLRALPPGNRPCTPQQPAGAGGRQRRAARLPLPGTWALEQGCLQLHDTFQAAESHLPPLICDHLCLNVLLIHGMPQRQLYRHLRYNLPRPPKYNQGVGAIRV